MRRTHWSPIRCIAALLAACSLATVASATTWPLADKLTADDGVAGDYFGGAVSIYGNMAIVGASFDDSSTGSAHIYEFDGSTWSQTAKLTASDAAGGDHFGHSVSISKDTAIVGAFANDDAGLSSGSAYLFEKDEAGWSEVMKLTAPDAAADDRFGQSVGVWSDGYFKRAVVGAYADDDKGSASGAAYTFTSELGSPWTQDAKLVASDGAAGDTFGKSVSIGHDRLIIGAMGDDDNGSSSGSAYVFGHNGFAWNRVAKVTAGDGASDDWFGRSVAISQEPRWTTIVGARNNDVESESGAAYIFDYDSGVYTQVAKLTADDGATGDYFGSSVALDGTTAIVGAYDDTSGSPSISAYIFEYDGSDWDQTDKLVVGDAVVDDFYSYNVSVSGDNAIIGVREDTENGIGSGAAFIYGASVSAEPVPEPMSMIFFGTGVVGVLGFVSRRKMQKTA
jgi:FG-GAP repeat